LFRPVEFQLDGNVFCTDHGTPGFDVSLIDPASIRLEGAAPVAWDLSDRGRPSVGCAASGPDGALDLTLMFRAQDIVSGINPVQDLELRVLRLTGSLRPHAGKKPIKGEDVMSLNDKARGRFGACRSSFPSALTSVKLKPNLGQNETKE